MRYHFIPYVYSLAHIAHEELRPIARPAIFEFPEWKSSDPEDEDVWGTWHTYMFGSHIVTGESACLNPRPLWLISSPSVNETVQSSRVSRDLALSVS